MDAVIKIFENIHFASYNLDNHEITTQSSWVRYEQKNEKVLFFNEAGNCQGFFKNAKVEIF